MKNALTQLSHLLAVKQKCGTLKIIYNTYHAYSLTRMFFVRLYGCSSICVYVRMCICTCVSSHRAETQKTQPYTESSGKTHIRYTYLLAVYRRRRRHRLCLVVGFGLSIQLLYRYMCITVFRLRPLSQLVSQVTKNLVSRQG